MSKKKPGGLWARLQDTLIEAGFDVELPDLSDLDPTRACKMICMPFGLAAAIEEMERNPRENVVMVRVDDDTKRGLDAWIESGVVKSRSEAAALFIREGLQMRAAELQELEGALRDVERAKERLRKKARSVLREDEPGAEPDDKEADND